MFNSDVNRVVEIDLKLWDHAVHYEVFFNLGLEELIEVARENEKAEVWTFNFLTVRVGDCEDYSPLEEIWPEIMHCVQPIYIGNLTAPGGYRQIVDGTIRALFPDSETVELGYYE